MNSKEQKAFSLIARLGSFRHAFRGVVIFVRQAHNAWVEIFFAGISICLGLYFCITSIEWIALTLAFGMLLMAEAFNTAMEVHMNLTSPEFHPSAKDTKDIAAGAVLISVFVVLILFALIFGPKVMTFLAL